MSALSSQTHIHPYLKVSFWANPDNQFWNRDAMYSDKTRELMNQDNEKFLKEMGNKRFITND